MPWSFWAKIGAWATAIGLEIASRDPVVKAGCGLVATVVAVWLATDSLLEADDAPEADD